VNKGDKIEDLVKQRDQLARDAENGWKTYPSGIKVRNPFKNVVSGIVAIVVPVIIVAVIIGICICRWKRKRATTTTSELTTDLPNVEYEKAPDQT
jgi:hypothetical protein